MIANNKINKLIYYIINKLIIKVLSNTFIQFKKYKNKTILCNLYT